jgi:hypothetical protein
VNSDRLPDLPSDLKSFEAQLAALSPASGLSRDDLLYRAGWEACASGVKQGANARQNRIHSWLWPASTAALVLLSVTLGLIVALRKPSVEVVYIERPPWATGVAIDESNSTWQPQDIPLPLPSGGNDYLTLRDRVLALGADLLATGAAAPKSDARIERDSRFGAMRGLLGDGLN